MAQLKVQHDVVETQVLRDHLEKNVADLESSLPADSAVTVNLKQVSKHLFTVDVKAQVFHKFVRVSAKDSNVLQAITRAKRHLLRQIETLRDKRRDRQRGRHGRRHLALAPSHG